MGNAVVNIAAVQTRQIGAYFIKTVTYTDDSFVTTVNDGMFDFSFEQAVAILQGEVHDQEKTSSKYDALGPNSDDDAPKAAAY